MSTSTMKWIVAFMLLLATMINYADRLTLSVVSRIVRGEFSLTEQDYSHIVTAFLVAYAIMYAGSGYLVDRLGTKRGFALFVFAWSLAQLAHSFVRGKWSLGACRFALGLAEPGNWPAAAKAVAEWFPARQRALGVGIFNAGSSIGSAIAPPMVAWITALYGWRASFLVTGALGIGWLVLWLLIYRTPAQPPDADAAGAIAASEGARPNWKQVMRRRECYTLILVRFFTDPVIYFAIFWLPEYLGKERGFDLAEIGRYAWVPFIFGDIGYMLGGWLSGRLIDAGWALPRARKFVMAVGAACLPVSIVAPLVPTAALAIAAVCFLTFGHGFWVANLQTLPTDIFRGGEIGTASGFSGSGGAIGGVIANLGTGWVVTHYSYAPVFAVMGLMHPLSAFLIYRMLPDRYFRRNE
jgi:ACS family hexuronate transporter-like MFS transporter